MCAIQPSPIVANDTKQSFACIYKILGFSEPYADYLGAPLDIVQRQLPLPANKRKGPRGGVVEPFPQKLYEMLCAVESEGFQEVVFWRSHGRCFEIKSTQAFVAAVLPRFFKQTKMTSFQRQLNLYGFQKITSGPDKGCYCHPAFLRGRPELCKVMIRTPIKKHGQRATFPLSGVISCQSLHDLPACPASNCSGPCEYETKRGQSFTLKTLEMTNDPLIEGLLTIMASEGGNNGQPNLTSVHSSTEITMSNAPVTTDQWNVVSDDDLSDDSSHHDELEGIVPIFQSGDCWENIQKMFESV